MSDWFDDYMKKMNPNYREPTNRFQTQPGDARNLLTNPLTGMNYSQFADARDASLNQLSNNPQDSLLSGIFNQLLQGLQSNAPKMPSPEEILLQATKTAASQYDPQISAIRKEMGITKGRAGRNKAELGAMYGGLADSYGGDVKASKKQYAAYRKQQKADLKDLQGELAGDYSDSVTAQNKEFQDLGVEAAAPEAAAGQNKDLQYLEKMAAVEGGAQANALNLQGAADESYYREGRGIAGLEGSEAKRDLMAQLSDYLQQRGGDLSGLQGQKKSAIEMLKAQLNQQAAEQQSKYAESTWDNLYKLAGLRMQMNNQGGGQQKQYSTGLLGANQALKDSLGATRGENLSGVLQQLLTQQPFREGRIKSGGETIKLTPEQAASYAANYADQQGLANTEKLALVQAVLAYYGRMGH